MLIMVEFIAGLLFGVGLALSGMANPAKVLGFLDLAGRWDPSLLLVMGGAVAVALVAFTFARRRRVSLLGEPMRLPEAARIDRKLLTGAALFGIGWGLAGFCPGPALVGLASGSAKAALFVAAMILGMAVHETAQRLKEKRATAPGVQHHVS